MRRLGIQSNIFSDTLTQQTSLVIVDINISRGDLTNISAITQTLTLFGVASLLRTAGVLSFSLHNTGRLGIQSKVFLDTLIQHTLLLIIKSIKYFLW